MAIKLKSNSAYDGQLQETNTAARQYYLPNNDSGLGTQLMTAQASTSGTVVDFTGIPSWVKRITVIFNGMSTNGTSNYLIQIGDGVVRTTGYTAYANVNNNFISSTAGFIQTYNNTAATAHTGTCVLLNMGSNTWVSAGQNGRSSDNAMSSSSGVLALAGALDRVRVTSVTPDTFDAGSINVMYE